MEAETFELPEFDGPIRDEDELNLRIDGWEGRSTCC